MQKDLGYSTSLDRTFSRCFFEILFLVAQICTALLAAGRWSARSKFIASDSRHAFAGTGRGKLAPALILICIALPDRKYRYDKNVTEYFVQTSDVVRVKRKDMEKWLSVEDAGKEAGLFVLLARRMKLSFLHEFLGRACQASWSTWRSRTKVLNPLLKELKLPSPWIPWRTSWRT
jgi:hypothetical protein